MKSDKDDSGFILKALSDSGVQISVLKAELLGDRQLDSLGNIKLQPFCGDPVEAQWVKLSVAPVNDQCAGNDEVVIDCAIVPNLNENMILSADVISRLALCDSKQQSHDVCDVMNTTVDGKDVVWGDVHNDVNLNGSVDDNVVINVVDNDNPADSVGDDNGEDLASREDVAREQRQDETLKSCFSLAKAGKGGFVLQDGLLYHRKTQHSCSWWYL